MNTDDERLYPQHYRELPYDRERRRTRPRRVAAGVLAVVIGLLLIWLST